MTKPSGIAQYQQVSGQVDTKETNSYKVVQMLLQGVIDKIDQAIVAISTGDVLAKGQNIGTAVTILDALQSSLDADVGGDVVENLFSLYQYMMEKMIIANLEDNIGLLEEVKGLILTVKSGWDNIEEEAIEVLKNKK